ncbi:hypothetical protein ACIGFK_13180 [Streptomyces sp. NPDC085524]|uniref:hypothetical protein n=1 Tax=Streptomyces sp. NPDC085524 TaxID=3365728 RepID=UPI0037D29A3E
MPEPDTAQSSAAGWVELTARLLGELSGLQTSTQQLIAAIQNPHLRSQLHEAQMTASRITSLFLDLEDYAKAHNPA